MSHGSCGARALFAIGAILFGTALLHAQTPTGVVDGVIRDESGQPVPGVTVVANSPALIQRDLTVVSDHEGYYRLQLLPPGVYAVRCELQGFQTVVREGLIVSAGQATTINMKLSVASLQESV